MRDNQTIDIDFLPMGYCEIKVTKNPESKNYAYQIVRSNHKFKEFISKQINSLETENLPCAGLEAELFSQQKLKSYFNVAVNNSFMEFEEQCESSHKKLIIKVQAITNTTLSIAIITIPTKKLALKSNAKNINFLKLADNSHDYLLIINLNLEIIYCNKNTAGLLKIERENQKFSVTEFIHPQDLKIAHKVIRDLKVNPNTPISSEIRVKSQAGGYLTLHFRTQNMIAVEGIKGVVIIAEDVTEKKKNEKIISDNKLYLESLFKAIPNLIFVLDYQGTFLDLKSRNYDKLAFQPEEFLGKNISALFPVFISQKVVCALKLLKNKEEVDPIPYQYTSSSGASGHFECCLSAINNEKVLAIINDVTTLKNAQEMLTNNQTLIQKKLDILISPEDNLDSLELSDLVNLDELKDMFLTIYEFTKIPIALLGKEGEILFTIGEEAVCQEFHLKKANSLTKCLLSNRTESKHIKMGENRLHKCLNNIWNFTCPIYVGGGQIATLDICKFRLAEDLENYDELLRHQANLYEFDKESYLKAYYSLPIIKKEQLLKVAGYYRDLISKITGLSYAQIKHARTANQLRIREEKLAQITDNMTDVIFINDLNFNVTYVSPSVEKLFGLTPEEYSRRTPTERFPESTIKMLYNKLNVRLKTNDDKNNENVLVEMQEYNAKGILIDISVHVKLLKDQNNQPIGIIGSARDISKRKEVEAKLHKQLQLQSILSFIAMHYINIPLDKIDASISESLKEFAQFTNADRAYIFKYDWDKATTSNTYEWCKEGIRAEIDSLQDIPTDSIKEWVQDHKIGKTILLENVAKSVYNDLSTDFLIKQEIKSTVAVPLMDNEACIGFVGFDSIDSTHSYNEIDIAVLKVFANLLVNISNRKLLGAELEKEREKATESDKLKTSLLNNLSHEFRTPLNGIIGFSELLKSKHIEVEYQKMAQMIFTSGIRLNYVLDSIMLLSQLESITEAKTISLERIHLTNLLLDLINQFKSQIELKGLNLISQLQPDVFANINENLFKQAVAHIINNALRYTHKGSITISCQKSLLNNSIELGIEDTGIGIPAESRELIYNNFRQVSEGYNRAYEGCGLGLPIAKKGDRTYAR